MQMDCISQGNKISLVFSVTVIVQLFSLLLDQAGWLNAYIVDLYAGGTWFVSQLLCTV
jgi:hypothetical protein